MVYKSPISWIVSFLSLLRIIPRVKSSLLDKIGLFVWTSVFLALAVANIYVNLDLLKEYLDNKVSVYNLFSTASGFVVPYLQIIGVLPLLHYLVSAYDHILQDPLLPYTKKSWLFIANALLCVTTSLIIVVPESPMFTDFQSLVNKSLYTILNSLHIISSFIIGVCTAQMTARLENIDLIWFSPDRTSEIIQEFRCLKAGLSPLLFFMFSTKCFVLIVTSLGLLTGQYYGAGATVAYIMMDITYITFVVDQTYESFKDMSLKLKLVKKL